MPGKREVAGGACEEPGSSFPFSLSQAADGKQASDTASSPDPRKSTLTLYGERFERAHSRDSK